MQRNSSKSSLSPWQTKAANDIWRYFKRIFGSDFKKIPFLELELQDYEVLFIKETGLFARSRLKKEDGIDTLFVALPRKRDGVVLLTFAIEDPTRVDNLLNALKINLQTSKEKTFFKALQRLQVHCTNLHQLWMKKTSSNAHELRRRSLKN